MGDCTVNFSYWESLVSKDHPEIIEELKEQGHPFQNEKDMFKLLCESIAQPARDKFGKLNVTSAGRPDKLNKAVGGVNGSDHESFAGMDLYPEEIKLIEMMFWWIVNHCPYRQVIWYKTKGFIHIAQNRPGMVYKHEHFITI